MVDDVLNGREYEIRELYDRMDTAEDKRKELRVWCEEMLDLANIPAGSFRTEFLAELFADDSEEPELLLDHISGTCMEFPPDSDDEDEDEEDEDEEQVYNGNGEPREYSNQPGTFYQTYGNGGGKNGWGGYWVRDGSQAVWEVAGQEFTYLEDKSLEFSPGDEMKGVIPTVKIVPGIYQQERDRIVKEISQIKDHIREREDAVEEATSLIMS